MNDEKAAPCDTRLSRVAPARESLFALALLVVLAVLFRLPVLINASALNSDTAIVGLQAMHLLRGQWSWLLWGVGYQSSADAILAGAAFFVAGASPLTLLLVPTLAHLLVICIAFAVLRRRVSTWSAFACALPLVFTPWAVNYMILYANREACIVLAFVSIWLLDSAPASKRGLLCFGAGSFLGAIAVAVDLYAILFVPGLIVLAAGSVADRIDKRQQIWRRLAACAIGVAIGSLGIVAIHYAPGATSSQASISLDRVNFNAALLWKQVLPFSLGYKLLHETDSMIRPILWHAPMPWLALQAIGGWSLLAGIFAAGVMSISSNLPWSIRRLGAMGCIIALATIASFVVSAMPVDLFSARYLGPMFWMAPFALTPIAARLGSRRFALALTPYLAVAAIGGWLSYGSFVAGPLPRVSAAAEGSQQRALRQFLLDHQIHYAAADYWLAYRLTFLWHEDPTVVPLDADEDRYPPYRDRYLAQSRTALLFDPNHSRRGPETFENYLRTNHIDFTTHEVAGWTVLLVQRDRP